MLEYDKNLKRFSRLLRKNMTDSEKALWKRIRRRQIHGALFNRQKPIGKYVVDFYSPTVELVIEIDGSQHLEQNHLKKDSLRDRYLCEQGLTVLRFNSRQVLLELDAVVAMVAMEVERKLKS